LYIQAPPEQDSGHECSQNGEFPWKFWKFERIAEKYLYCIFKHDHIGTLAVNPDEILNFVHILEI
jgi:hypothetical protein